MANDILVTRPLLPDKEEYYKEIESIWETRWLTNMGEKHRMLQQELKRYLGVENIDLLTNGHMALELSLQALNLKPGSEIITTPFTFVSTTHAIARNGLKPVFCDVNPVDYTIDADKIEDLITDNTSAIMPVHVYGNVCDVEKIGRIAQKYNLKVIYDAAHAFGVTYRGKGIGSFGDVSCFSFHATKVFNTVEGGASCYHDEAFGKRLYGLKDFGIRDQETVDQIGANAKMNEFCAAMGLCNLRHVNDAIQERAKIVERYRENLDGIPGLQLNVNQKDVKQNYAYFPVVFDEKTFGSSRDDVKEKLAENHIWARKYFYPTVNSMDCYRQVYNANDTPIALRLSHKILTLPLYADLTLKDVDRICQVIVSCRK